MEQEHLCDHCGKKFGTRGGLSRHKRSVHTNVAPYQCCGLMFYSITDYRRHRLDIYIQYHDYQHSPKINIRFLRMYYIAIMLTIWYRNSLINLKHNALFFSCNKHGEEKKFKCSSCEKSFATKGILNEHMSVHNQELHDCDSCTSSFPRKRDLDNHVMAVHNQIKVCLYLWQELLVQNKP